MVTTSPHQERAGVTNQDGEDRSFSSNGEAAVYWAKNLYAAQQDSLRGGSIFALLGPIGILQRLGVKDADIDAVIRASSRHLPFPLELFQDKAA